MKTFKDRGATTLHRDSCRGDTRSSPPNRVAAPGICGGPSTSRSAATRDPLRPVGDRSIGATGEQAINIALLPDSPCPDSESRVVRHCDKRSIQQRDGRADLGRASLGASPDKITIEGSGQETVRQTVEVRSCAQHCFPRKRRNVKRNGIVPHLDREIEGSPRILPARGRMLPGARSQAWPAHSPHRPARHTLSR